MLAIELNNVSKSYGDVRAVDGVSLSVPRGRRTILVGCSGAGKTTLLRIIAGLESVDEGHVFLNDQDVTQLPPAARSVAMVSQDFALYPQQTVRQNLETAVKRQRLGRQERDERILETLARFEIRDLQSHHPGQLSGGQAQRAAFAKALVARPEILLLDEPLSQIDGILKEPLMDLILSMTAQFNVTTVMVTHAPLDTMRLADHIAVLHEGKVIDEGEPARLYERPRSRIVGSLLSPLGMNWLETSLTGGAICPPPEAQGDDDRRKRFLGFRPEDVMFRGQTDAQGRGQADSQGDELRWEGSKMAIQNLGFAKLVLAKVNGQTIRALCGHEVDLSADTIYGVVPTNRLCWADD